MKKYLYIILLVAFLPLFVIGQIEFMKSVQTTPIIEITTKKIIPSERMCWFGNYKPIVYIGSQKTGSFLVNNEKANYNVIISDTITGEPIDLGDIILFESPIFNVWIDKENWWAQEYLTEEECNDIMRCGDILRRFQVVRPCRFDAERIEILKKGTVLVAIEIIEGAISRGSLKLHGNNYINKNNQERLKK